MQKLANQKNSLLLSQMFEIEEDQNEYLSDESPKSAHQIPNESLQKKPKMGSRRSIKHKMKRNEILRQERMRKKFSKIEAIKKIKQEEQNRKLREERETQKMLRKQIDDKIRERRKQKQKNERAKQERNRQRKQNQAKAKRFYQDQLKKKFMRKVEIIVKMNQQRTNRVKQKMRKFKLKQCLSSLKKMLRIKRESEDLLVESFECSVKRKLRIKAGFLNLVESCRLSKEKDSLLVSEFYGKLLKKKSLSIWKENLKYLRTENFWIKEAQKKTVKMFEKRRRILVFKMCFAALKQNQTKRKLLRKKEEHRKEMRVKVDSWLKEFETKQLR